MHPTNPRLVNDQQRLMLLKNIEARKTSRGYSQPTPRNAGALNMKGHG